MATLNRHAAPSPGTTTSGSGTGDSSTRSDAPGAEAGRHTEAASAVRRPRGRAPQSRVAYGIGIATVCTLALGNLMVGERATATVEPSASVTVAEALGLDTTAADRPAGPQEAEVLGQLAASRAERDEQRAAAGASQAEAERAEAEATAAAERAAAEAAAAEAAAIAEAAIAEAAAAAEAATAEAAAAAEAEAAAAAAAAAEAEAGAGAEAGAAAGSAGDSGGSPAPTPEPAASGTAVTATARISNSAGPIRPQAQAAADLVVSNVPGAAGITIGGTRPSAADPGGHPSGLALDYMVMSDSALGDAIVAYHLANWDTLGVDYIIWQQRYLGSPGGSWRMMENRGSPTANHMDHPHVNYRG